MRRLYLALFFICLSLCATASFAFTAPNPSDYTVAVHVSSSRTAWQSSAPGSAVLVLNVTIDGVKSELKGAIENGAKETKLNTWDGFLALGDYKAMLLTNKLKDPNVPYFVIKTYELLLPDGRLARFQLTGQSE